MSKDESNRTGTPTICPDCHHEVSRHGVEGCDVELGDAWVEGQNSGALMAQGICSCSAWEQQISEEEWKSENYERERGAQR